MPLAALLVVGAALCHSTWNLLIKTQTRRLEIQSDALVVARCSARPCSSSIRSASSPRWRGR